MPTKSVKITEISTSIREEEPREASAVPLSPAQSEKLTQKLSASTGKTVRLTNKVDPAVLGGVQLDMGNRRVEDTVAGRLDAISKLLRKTTL